ncbi:Bifunctional methionine biosynthesis protein MetXA/MetW [BD1-7 clade bacterium]|uniref:Bifunctional methionine biosynthesis protein MetXA/MetW n=1 Tax=BD1-7 clade bacterium TaxID=2029982 RepID=A0A5S9MZS3_9GAMM|nr:Bifunctional methionine biosynthesis protein MetXA/MetW [BD1-7 clade bacterium]CAA0082777.1 Bifunctional methionine biosynthesis protein MetXA/MetW [BD1-7 clade bacterium]
MRFEFSVIQDWIQPHSRVLDLGCGDGTLLAALQKNKGVRGLGIEIEPAHFDACILRGLSVINQNLDKGLDNFTDQSFDTVVMTLTLQAMRHPDEVLEETLRVGKESIVAFPNFGHWRCRLHLITKGRMPVSKFMPYSWYNTPNIHFCTVRDFEDLCAERSIRILNKEVTSAEGRLPWLARLWPNLFASVAIYHLSR